MMIGEFLHTSPTVQIPPHWDPYEDPTAEIISPFSTTPSFGSPDYINYNNNPFNKPDSFGSLQRYDSDNLSDEFPDLPPDAFTSDNFRMYEFKVRRCSRGRSHDWTECPFAHPGEKARRRDPRKYNYSCTACPEFRKGACRRGETCEFAHGVFECWLHPDRYRTQACKDGIGCRRRICFFAHSPEQLRVVNLQSPNRSLKSFRRSFDSYTCTNVNNINNMTSFGLSSPTTSPPCSPPISLSSLVSNMRNLQLASPTSVWGLSTVGSPMGGANLRHGFCSGPTTPTRVPRLCQFEEWECGNNPEVGLELRAKLSKEKCFGSVKECDPDVGWISDLVQ